MRGLTARRLRSARGKNATKQTDGRTLRIERDTLDKVEAAFAIMANLTIIVALVVAWLSYDAQVRQAKRDAAFHFVAGLNEGEILAAQRRFVSELTRIEIGNLRDMTVPRDTMATIVRQLVSTSQDPGELRQDIITIVGYFDNAQICLESGTCDEHIMLAHILDVASRYACLLIPYVNAIRDEFLIEGLGDGLQRLVDYQDRC